MSTSKRFLGLGTLLVGSLLAAPGCESDECDPGASQCVHYGASRVCQTTERPCRCDHDISIAGRFDCLCKSSKWAAPEPCPFGCRDGACIPGPVMSDVTLTAELRPLDLNELEGNPTADSATAMWGDSETGIAGGAAAQARAAVTAAMEDPCDATEVDDLSEDCQRRLLDDAEFDF